MRFYLNIFIVWNPLADKRLNFREYFYKINRHCALPLLITIIIIFK